MSRKLSTLYSSAKRHIALFSDYTKHNGLIPAVRHSLFVLQSTQLKPSEKSKEPSPPPDSEKIGRKFSICFLSGESGTPGHKYRVSSLAACLPQNLYHLEVLSQGKEALQNLSYSKTFYDVLWIWRLPMDSDTKCYLNFLRTSGTRIHYDVDDLMVNPDLAKISLIDGIRSMGLEEEKVKKFYQQHLNMLHYADHASSPTHILTSQMLFFNPNVWTVPNTFSSSDLVKARKARCSATRDGLFRMGYASGSRTHQKDFARILPAICDILKKHPHSRLVVYPQTLLLEEFNELKEFENQIEKRDMVPVEQLVFEYAHYDVNLCPLETDNIFCQCKSQLKFFEAALCKTPTVASPTDPFAKYIEHGVNGFLADNPEEWRICLEALARDMEFRSTVGNAAYRSVLWAFSPDFLRLSVESVLFPSAQADAFALKRITHKGLADSVPLPDVEIIHENTFHFDARVTVVIPCFNYAHFIEEALESVRLQTLDALDLVIVDDCSTDHSLVTAQKWIEKNQKRFGSVKLLKNKTNSKLAKTRNAGVDFCETEFFFPLDPDNHLEKNCLKTLLNTADAEKCGFVYPSLSSIGIARTMPNPMEWSVHSLRNGNYIDAMALIRKSVWICVGGYTHDSRITGWEDFEFWCKCAESSIYGKLCRDAVAFYRAHAESMLSTITDRPGYLDTAKKTMRSLHPWLVLP
jgi:glycosyltransferase involved in cell wall biosynthesis